MPKQFHDAPVYHGQHHSRGICQDFNKPRAVLINIPAVQVQANQPAQLAEVIHGEARKW
jgi:hypothetical protein